jgi:hypothetical protein
MRLIHYSVFNKKIKKIIYTNCRLHKCTEKFNSLENKEDFEIRYKWVSI